MCVLAFFGLGYFWNKMDEKKAPKHICCGENGNKKNAKA